MSRLTDKAAAFSAYNLVDEGNAAKIRFGKNGEEAREWLIAGEDGENTLALLSTTAFGDSTYGSNAIYGNDSAETEDSYVLKYLRTCMSGMAYFSAAEKSESIMKKTTVKTTAYNGVEKSVTGQLYLPDAVNREAATNAETSIYIGANNDKEISLTNLTANGGPSSEFWLRSPYHNNNGFALVASDKIVDGSMVFNQRAVVPAFNLNLSDVSFASAATAASSATGSSVPAEKTYTLRYTPAEESDLAKASAEINRTGDAITVKNAKSDMYLVVQNSTGVYSAPLEGGTKTVAAQAVEINEVPLTDFDNCKVWIETTTNNLTYAKPATQKTTEDITEAAITGITAPVAGEALDVAAACATTGVVETTPAVTWTLGGEDVTGNAASGRRYQASVTLTAKDGYTFTDAATAKLNDEEAITEINENGKKMTIRYTFPRTALKAVSRNAVTNYFAAKSDLMESFGLQKDDTIGKIIFGQNGANAAQVWEIAGVDEGITGDNVVLFADSALGTSAFESIAGKKTYSADWNCTYLTDTNITEVNPNHYGASKLRAALSGYMKADNTSYFSTAEKALMNGTKVYTKDTNNSNATYYTTDTLYAAQADDSGQGYITVGSNIMTDSNAGILIDKSNWNEGNGDFWLRSPHDGDVGNALLACQGDGVGIGDVGDSQSVVPAFNLKLADVLFAASATAASSAGSGALDVSEGKTYTLRYTPEEGSDLAKASAVINKAGTEIMVMNPKSGMYLIVQNSEGAYEVSLAENTKTVSAGSIQIDGTALSNVNNCKVWLETTNDNLTCAKLAAQRTTEDITEVTITGITEPVAGEALGIAAACATTGVVENTPAVTWTLEDESVSGNAAYGRCYQACVTLTAKEGYVFTEYSTAKLNGQEAITEISEDGKKMTIRYTFPGVSKGVTNYFATKSELMESFGLKENDIVGKIIFGKNGQTGEGQAAQVWKIAGVDREIAGDNIVLFADSALGESVFATDAQNKKVYSTAWNCTYPNGEVITEVNPNYYGASELRATLSGYMKEGNTSYFSTAEKAQMNETNLYTYDTNNKQAAYYTTDKLYVAKQSFEGVCLIVGSNTLGSRNAGIPIDKSNWNEGSFWLCEVHVTNPSKTALVSGYLVANEWVTSPAAVVPAFDLKLSDVLFASAATAASSGSGALDVSAERTYTLRYAPKAESDLAKANAEISRTGTKITVTNPKSGMYLIVQNSEGAYGVSLADDTETVSAGSIKINGTDLTDFNHCKVWLESTNDNLTYAKLAEQSSVVGISEAAITGITAPAAGEALDMTAACAATGIAETSPVVNWTPEDTTAAYSTAYTASITLTAAENYEFAEDVTATVNGNPASISFNPNGTITAAYTFAKTAEEPEPPVETGTIDLTKGSIAKIKAMVYTGSKLTPVLTVKCDQVKLEEGSDYTVSYENNYNAGTAKVTVTGIGDYYGTLSKEFTINQKALNKSTMSIKDLAATGSALNPAVSLTDGNKELTLGTDYKVKNIKNNTNPGKAQFTLEGIGNYKGTIRGTFQIYEAGVSVLSDCTVTVDETEASGDGIVYTGKAIKPDVKVTDVSGNEIDRKNYKITYKKNKNAGIATITIKGKGRTYKGTTIQHFTILPKNIKDIYSIENVKSKTYTGYVVKQNPKVKLLAAQTGGKKTLTANTEYTISYTNAVRTGTEAVITVTGTGNYEGSLTATYAIGKKDISRGIKVASIKAQKYTGLEITPELKVTYGKRVLVKGRDYNVKFANNTDKGKAAITLTGIGNYEGTLNKQFRIK